jgi:hypothetical protein
MLPAKFGSIWPSSFRGKHVQHVKIYMPCNFEVNLITRLAVIALFFSSPGLGQVSYCHHFSSVVRRQHFTF